MSESKRHPNVVHVDELPPLSREKGTRFRFAGKRLGAATGARGVGCSWYEVPPGSTAFPAHYHCATEEAIFILEGQGTVRIGEDRVEVRAGHYVTFPIGPDHAHQLVNTGDGPLRYLCMSDQHTADVVGYPDSNKIAAIAAPPGGDIKNRWVASWFPEDAAVDYFTGEDSGE